MPLPMHTKCCLLPLLALLVAASPALGGEIYHWVDEQGVTNFSQVPPDDPELAARVMHLDNLSTIPPVDVAALLEVADRLEASRLAREQARAAERQAAREARLQARTPPAVIPYHPSPLLHGSFFHKPPTLHPHVRPIDEIPQRRPQRKTPGPGLVPAVASGLPAQR